MADAPPSPLGIPVDSIAWPVALAVVVALLSGGNTLLNGFAYDDFAIVKYNPAVWVPNRGAEIWTTDYWAHTRGYDANRDLLYRPLTVFTFRLNNMAGGDNPTGYHAVNVLLHTLVAALVVVLAACVGCGQQARALAGVLFAAMPIHTEAVANVVGRAELLAAFFALAALTLVWRATRATGALAALWYALSGVCVLAALLSKESGIAAVVLVPLFAFVAQWPAGRGRRVLMATMVVLAALVPYLVLRYHALGGQLLQTTVPSRITNVMVDATAAERFWGAWQLFGMYITKTVWPQDLCMDYSFQAVRLAASPTNLHVAIGVLSVAALVVVIVLAWRSGQQLLALTGAAVVLSYLSVSNTLFLIKTLFAERVWYLPSVFLAVVVGAVIARWLRTPRRQKIGHWVMLVIVLAGLARCWERNADWRNNWRLFRSAYRVHPTSVPVMYCYGSWLAGIGNPLGLELLERSVQIAPGLFDAQWALGRAYADQGDDERALRALKAAVMQQPHHPQAVRLLKEVSARVAEARRADLVQLRQRYAQSGALPDLLAWIDALLDTGQVGDALSVLAAEEGRFGDHAAYHHTRAVILMVNGRRDEAVESYRRSIALDGGQPEVLVELASALADRHEPGDVPEAEELIDRAFRLNPDNPQTLIARAELSAIQGRRTEAIEIYRRLIERLPPGELRTTLETRLEILEHDY